MTPSARLGLLVASGALLAGSGTAQTPASAPPTPPVPLDAIPRCGTDVFAPRPVGEAALAPSDCSSTSTTILPQYEPAGGMLFQIPVVFHVIENTSGEGQIPDAAIRSQIDVLNEDYLALPGTPGALGADTGIQFYLATEDPNGDPTTGITHTVNDTWFNDEGNYWDPLAWDPNRYLNVYTNLASGFLGYATTIPQFGGVGDNEDRVVMSWCAVGRNAPIGPPFDQGRTLTHEVAHHLGLLHTFQGGCAPVATCYENGDLICDTNAQSVPSTGCPVSPSSCGTPDPFDNYLDYTDDACMARFTPEQANRMRCTLDQWRPGLHRAFCGSAAGVLVRNAGANPNVYTADPPALGRVQEYRVTTTPYSFAKIIAYAAPGSLTLKGGQVVLVDLASPKLFSLPTMAGPNAVAAVTVPLDVAFCGLQASTQAILFGGVQPYALTNAVDLTSGD